MKWLIDTHILIFLAEGSARLAREAKKILEDENNELRLSTVTLWEISIKNLSGKLKLSAATAEHFCNEFGIGLLPVLPQHIRKFNEIDPTHLDPFDRLLVAQAESTPLYFMTQDSSLASLGQMVRVY